MVSERRGVREWEGKRHKWAWNRAWSSKEASKRKKSTEKCHFVASGQEKREKRIQDYPWKNHIVLKTVGQIERSCLIPLLNADSVAFVSLSLDCLLGHYFWQTLSCVSFVSFCGQCLVFSFLLAWDLRRSLWTSLLFRLLLLSLLFPDSLSHKTWFLFL